MMKAVLLNLFAILVILHPAHGQVCEIKNTESGELKGRKVSIIFPDGKEITVIGHRHISKDILNKIRTMNMNLSQVKDKNKLFTEIKQILEEGKTVTKYYEEEKRFVENELAKNRLHFVAMETTMVGATFVGEEARAVNNNLKSFFLKHGIRDSSAIEKLVLLVGGPGFYVQNTNPAIFKDTFVTGVEHEELILKSEKQLLEALSQSQRILTLAKVPNPDSVSEQFLSLILENYHLLDEMKEEQFQKHILSYIDKNNKETAKKILPYAMDAIKSIRARDRHNVNQLLNFKRSGSGVLSIGRAHVKSTAQLLAMECKKQMTATAPGYGSPSTNATAFTTK